MTDPLPSPLKHAGRRAFLRAAVLGAAVLPLAACVGDEDSLAKQAREGNNKNYIAGDGSVEEYGPGSRTAPVEISAVAYDGTAIDSATWVGQATVLNFWYAACTPCRIEAPHLVELSSEYEGKVEFIGINVRDEKEAAEAFERTLMPMNSTLPSYSLLSSTRCGASMRHGAHAAYQKFSTVAWPTQVAESMAVPS